MTTRTADALAAYSAASCHGRPSYQYLPWCTPTCRRAWLAYCGALALEARQRSGGR